MTKILALGAHKGIKTIKPSSETSDLEIVTASLDEVELFINEDKYEVKINDLDIQRFDYVWLTSSWRTRTIAYAVYLYLIEHGISCNEVEPEKSKLTDMIEFALNGLNVPNTYFISKRNIKAKIKSIEDFCEYPFILKPTRGSLGTDVLLIKSEAEFKEILPKLNRNEKYICQKFIPNTFDYRIIVGNGKVVSACERVRQDDEFRNNTYRGAQENFLDIAALAKTITDMALLSASVLNLTWAGVDVVTSSKTGKNYILELNRSPGLTIGSTEISAASDYIQRLGDSEYH